MHRNPSLKAKYSLAILVFAGYENLPEEIFFIVTLLYEK
jgi:hypothetical protein